MHPRSRTDPKSAGVRDDLWAFFMTAASMLSPTDPMKLLEEQWIRSHHPPHLLHTSCVAGHHCHRHAHLACTPNVGGPPALLGPWHLQLTQRAAEASPPLHSFALHVKQRDFMLLSSLTFEIDAGGGRTKLSLSFWHNTRQDAAFLHAMMKGHLHLNEVIFPMLGFLPGSAPVQPHANSVPSAGSWGARCICTCLGGSIGFAHVRSAGHAGAEVHVGPNAYHFI